MKADLHLHTCYSDGTDHPAQLVDRAARCGFQVIAITDHDTVEGVSEAMVEGKRLGVQVIPGVEITSKFRNHELHVLAYFSPQCREQRGWKHPRLWKELHEFENHRTRRIEEIVRRLNEVGIVLTMEDVIRQTQGKEADGGEPCAWRKRVALGRPHVAAALVSRGVCSSIDAAFQEYLVRGCSTWVDKPRADIREVVSLIHEVGGVSILAHPGLLHNDSLVAQVMNESIDGLEVYHTRHTPTQSTRYRSMAHDRHLLVTGGSDCHGMRKGKPLLGHIQFGSKELDQFLERIDALAGC